MHGVAFSQIGMAGPGLGAAPPPPPKPNPSLAPLPPILLERPSPPPLDILEE